jgi:hypothetical protein
MIRAIRWLWVVLPRGWIVAVFVVSYLVVEIPFLWLDYCFGNDDVMQDLWRRGNQTIGLWCFAYGVFRVIAFHPLFRPEYCKWLELTPWTSRKPLPAGPIHLVPQDAVVLGILIALMHTTGVVLLQVLLAFAFAYHAALALSLWPTGERWRSYFIVFVLGGAVRLIQYPPLALALLVALYPFTYLSLRRSLERFPWQLPDWWPRLELKPQATREDRKAGQKVLGWPYDLLQPIKSRQGISFSDGTAVSVLLGWWVYAIVANVPAEDQKKAGFLALIAVSYLVLSRVLLYCMNHWWPISLWGRLRTGRWIIPRYDRVFVAPVLTVIVQSVGLTYSTAFPFDVAVGTGIALAFAMAILLNMGPTLTEWRLTGGHRIVAGMANKRDFVQI